MARIEVLIQAVPDESARKNLLMETSLLQPLPALFIVNKPDKDTQIGCVYVTYTL